ncbi:hypothetical protein CRUP_028366, partial [Coryphaenoides rupestris]
MRVPSQGSDTIASRSISGRSHAATVHLRRPSVFGGTDVTCNGPDNGATIFVGYPPRDRALTCETRDLESVECSWRADGNTVPLANNRMQYKLLGSSCSDTSKSKCRHEERIEAGERNWTLTVENKLGTLELTDRADLTKR